MVDQALVQSGFDIEVLLSERYLRYALLAQVEAGLLPLSISVVDTAAGTDVSVTIHPPTDYGRRYEPDPAAVLPDPADGSFATELIFDDADGANLQLTVVADIVDNTTGEAHNAVSIGLLFAVTLTADEDDRGFQRNQRLTIVLIKLDPLIQIVLALAHLDPNLITQQIKAQVDRSVPFGVASGQSVQQAAIQLVFPTGGRPAALGAYINLALKNGTGPDDFVAARGDLANGANFLDAGRDLAFAMSPALFGMLGPDAFFRMAEEDPAGSGNFSHPLRKQPGNRDSERIGTLKRITIGPEVDQNGPTGRLLIDVHGEYTLDVLPDPDFDLLLFLKPVIEDGILRWESEVKIDVGLLGSLLSIVAIVIVTLLGGPGAGLGMFLAIFLLDAAVDAVATAFAAGQADAQRDASFLDALPNRLALAQRRWDPLYRTDHQVVALIQSFTINAAGMAFDGDAVLDKAPVAIAHVVVRDEVRDGDGHISGLHYRVRDLPSIAADIVAIGPGADRRAFELVDGAIDPRSEANLVALTLEQAGDRMAADRIIHPILYTPAKIHLDHHTIDALLLLSSRERDEQRSALIDAFRGRTDAQIRADQGTTLTAEETARLVAALGRDPTQEEIDAAVTDRVNALVDEAQKPYEADRLDGDLAAATDRILRFDARPNEIAALQGAGVLAVAGKEIVRMHSGTVYYRDHPDFVFRDNLLALPHYRPPYQPPV